MLGGGDTIYMLGSSLLLYGSTLRRKVSHTCSLEGHAVITLFSYHSQLQGSKACLEKEEPTGLQERTPQGMGVPLTYLRFPMEYVYAWKT